MVIITPVVLFYITRVGGMAAILLGTYLIAHWMNQATCKLDRNLDQKIEKEPSNNLKVEELSLDATYYRFFKHFITAFIYLVGACLALSLIPQFRAVAYSILAGSGLVSLILTFTSREAFSNLLSGMVIALFRPFQVGNHVKIGKDIEGKVKDITLHHTIIITEHQNHLMIPNATITSQTIENITWHAPEIAIPFDLYISYKADIDKVIDTVQAIIAEHPLLIDKRSEEDKTQKKSVVEANVEKLLPGAIHVRAWIYAKNEGEAYRISCDSFRKVKKAFDAKNIPFPETIITESAKELSL